MRKINEIIVHCTATFPEQKVDVQTVTRWHKQRGWKTIGYHFLVLQDGTVQRGRAEDEVGAHCQGHNANSIGVCYVGGLDINTGKPADTRTEEQKVALVQLLMELHKKYPKAKIYGHRDFANKACPSFDATKEYENLCS